MTEKDTQSEILARLDERTKSMQDNIKLINDSMSSVKTDMKNMNDVISKKIQDTSDNVNMKIDIMEKRFESKLENEIKKTEIKFENELKKAELRVESLAKEFVKVERIDPIEKIVYGLVALVLTAFATGLIAIIFNQSGN